MVMQLRRRGAILAMAITAVLTAVLGMGTVSPALADPEDEYTNLEDVMLTKVIVAPNGTDTSLDNYVFHFAGGGKVIAHGGVDEHETQRVFSDNVEQDNTTIKIDDEVPTIGDVTLNGVAINETNSLSNGQSNQVVVQKSIKTILTEKNVVFPHAGVYTYIVTEKSVSINNTGGTGTGTGTGSLYVNASQAEYVLRVYVRNTNTGATSNLGTGVSVSGVTLQQTKDDNGDTVSQKVNPTYPKIAGTGTSGPIAYTANEVSPATGKLAGDERGRKVPGFTFANEYIRGGSFMVKKLYDGRTSDRTRYSTVELAIYSSAAANEDARGCCLTYRIEGNGKDLTNNYNESGERLQLNGVFDIPQVNDSMVKFDNDGWAYLKADLMEGSTIRVTGEFGPYNSEYAKEAPNQKDCRMTLSTTGLLNGQTYYVIERTPGDYRPKGYVYTGSSESADPRVDATGMSFTDNQGDEHEGTDPLPGGTLTFHELCVTGTATGAATTVFVVNTIDESKVSITGIFIDNLPYILMVGIPVAVLGVMFANRVRKNAAA